MQFGPLKIKWSVAQPNAQDAQKISDLFRVITSTMKYCWPQFCSGLLSLQPDKLNPEVFSGLLRIKWNIVDPQYVLQGCCIYSEKVSPFFSSGLLRLQWNIVDPKHFLQSYYINSNKVPPAFFFRAVMSTMEYCWPPNMFCRVVTSTVKQISKPFVSSSLLRLQWNIVDPNFLQGNQF